ncbi:DUF1214 domain-containing protein [Rhizobium halophytocola]|uniref:DUF1214 domain-containing protein n=1 Tax=Rhizobium halophytocola TaxID=735519 RepID=A0ABS4E5P4_9HYPH|nr:hypothetical protein [Rhizobium halophytocola]
MFRVPFLVAIALAIAFGGGIASAISALNASVGAGAIQVGVWHAFPKAQTAQADPYAKAHRARTGKLLYGSAEGLTFTAETDESGERLIATCSYRVHGTPPPARIFTLYAARRNGTWLKPDSALPGAYNSLALPRRPDGQIEVTVSPTAKPFNWLALPDAGNFTLVLTLFDTPAAGNSGLISYDMPKVEKIGCGHE